MTIHKPSEESVVNNAVLTFSLILVGFVCVVMYLVQ